MEAEMFYQQMWLQQIGDNIKLPTGYCHIKVHVRPE
jgi:hypothetical protein